MSSGWLAIVWMRSIILEASGGDRIAENRFLRCGSAIFVAGAGNREIARCDGVDISWQAQYFVRVRRVDAERFVAGAGNREVVSCGRGECRCHIGIGV